MEMERDVKESLFNRRDFLKISGLTTGAISIGSWGNGQLAFAKDVYPAEKISLVVPYKAGGGYDLYLRSLSPYLARYLRVVSPGAKGGDIVMRNEPAAAGRKGYSLIFAAKPNGYTIGAVGTGSLIESIVEKPEFDFTKLTFLTLGNASVKMVLGPAKGFANWGEVVSAMKKGPVKMAAGSFGRANHTCGIILNETAGTNFKLINFPGTAEGINALMRGDVQVGMLDEEPTQGLIEANELRVLLVFTEVSAYPGAVSAKDIGHPEFADTFTDMRFVVGPPGLEATPRKILIETLKKAQNDPAFVAWADKFKFRLKNIYGDDAAKVLMKFVKFYEGMAPRLRKYR
jgi:tripartite-type tricarboxylate transporter receptor subunit TctC